MLELMFKNQEEWMQTPDKSLRGYAKQAGMKDEDVDLCFKNEKLLDDLLDVVKQAVAKFQVRSTPTFIVGPDSGVIVEGEAWEPLKEAIDKALGIISS
jgi:protein-disulfide isomerase